MSVRNIVNSTIGLEQINDFNNNPAITISLEGIVELVSPAQQTATSAYAAISQYQLNQAISNASVALNANGSYIWQGNYNIFGNNQTIGIGSSTLPTSPPVGTVTSTSTGLIIDNSATSVNETDFYNFSNLGVGGFNFYNLSNSSPLKLFTTLRPNGGAPIMNLVGNGGQYQVNGVNILNNLVTTSQLTGLAPINSPAFTGVPISITPPFGNNTSQIATCNFVQSAVQNVMGAFNPDESYVWGSGYQTFGNNQLVNIGSSTMPVTNPNLLANSATRGIQINNNLDTNSETDLLNFSNAGTGGFAFKNITASTPLKNLATITPITNGAILNLVGTASQFEINGTTILQRQVTPTLSSVPFFAPQSFTQASVGGNINSTLNSDFTLSRASINGVTTISISGNILHAYMTLSNINYTPTGGSSQDTTTCIFCPIANPQPSQPVSIPITLTSTTGGSIIPATITIDSGSIVFSCQTSINFDHTLTYNLPNFQITYI